MTHTSYYYTSYVYALGMHHPWFDIDLYKRGFDPNSTGYFVELTDGSTTKSFMSSLKDSDKNKSQHWRNLNSWVAST